MIGFGFSFAFDQTAIDNGKLLRWTKVTHKLELPLSVEYRHRWLARPDWTRCSWGLSCWAARVDSELLPPRPSEGEEGFPHTPV
jgi:hypothetical protein